jgi:hypothetical protein
MEEWKDIEDYEGLYQVSNFGMVRSLEQEGERKQGGQRRNSNLCPSSNGNGYVYVSLIKNKQRKNFYIHRLVARAFIENTNKKRFVNHKNGIKDHNTVANLEWCTESENVNHAYKTGLIPKGEKSHLAKLKTTDILTIRLAHSAGVKQSIISSMYDISRASVHRIVHRKAWKHIA